FRAATWPRRAIRTRTATTTTARRGSGLRGYRRAARLSNSTKWIQARGPRGPWTTRTSKAICNSRFNKWPQPTTSRSRKRATMGQLGDLQGGYGAGAGADALREILTQHRADQIMRQQERDRQARLALDQQRANDESEWRRQNAARLEEQR